jgi:hypothetical protein
MLKVLLVACLVTVGLAGGAAAQGGGQAAQFLIVSGPGAGEAVLVDGNTGKTGADLANPLKFVGASASGSVDAASPGCDGMSFHGTLNGKPDPDPAGCGWGKVVYWYTATKLVQGLVNAITLEGLALEDISTAGKQLERSVGSLEFAHNHDAAAALNRNLLAKVRARIAEAIKGDTSAAGQVPAAGSDSSAFKRIVETAVQDKRRALQLVPEQSILQNQPARGLLFPSPVGAGYVTYTNGGKTTLHFAFRSTTKVARYVVLVHGAASISSFTVTGSAQIGTAEGNSSLAVVSTAVVDAKEWIEGEIELSNAFPAGTYLTVGTSPDATGSDFSQFTLNGALLSSGPAAALPAASATTPSTPSTGGAGASTGKKGKKPVTTKKPPVKVPPAVAGKLYTYSFSGLGFSFDYGVGGHYSVSQLSGTGCGSSPLTAKWALTLTYTDPATQTRAEATRAACRRARSSPAATPAAPAR